MKKLRAHKITFDYPDLAGKPVTSTQHVLKLGADVDLAKVSNAHLHKAISDQFPDHYKRIKRFHMAVGTKESTVSQISLEPLVEETNMDRYSAYISKQSNDMQHSTISAPIAEGVASSRQLRTKMIKRAEAKSRQVYNPAYGVENPNSPTPDPDPKAVDRAMARKAKGEKEVNKQFRRVSDRHYPFSNRLKTGKELVNLAKQKWRNIASSYENSVDAYVAFMSEAEGKRKTPEDIEAAKAYREAEKKFYGKPHDKKIVDSEAGRRAMIAVKKQME